jgi:hypothetical protein
MQDQQARHAVLQAESAEFARTGSGWAISSLFQDEMSLKGRRDSKVR